MSPRTVASLATSAPTTAPFARGRRTIDDAGIDLGDHDEACPHCDGDGCSACGGRGLASASTGTPSVFDHLRSTIALDHDERPLRVVETARVVLALCAFEARHVSPADFAAVMGWLLVEHETQLDGTFLTSDGPSMRAYLRALAWLEAQPASPLMTFARRWVAGWREIGRGEIDARRGEESVVRAAMHFAGAVEALAIACEIGVDKVLERIDEGELLGPTSSTCAPGEASEAES